LYVWSALGVLFGLGLAHCAHAHTNGYPADQAVCIQPEGSPSPSGLRMQVECYPVGSVELLADGSSLSEAFQHAVMPGGRLAYILPDESNVFAIVGDGRSPKNLKTYCVDLSAVAYSQATLGSMTPGDCAGNSKENSDEAH
jgi:hypothetical protein